MPSAPSATTQPSKSVSPRAVERVSPSGPTHSTAATAEASDPMTSPEPCVPVATAPATEMCGSDAIDASAQPWRCSSAARSP